MRLRLAQPLPSRHWLCKLRWSRPNVMSRLVSKVKELAPYAALELVMPGGSLMALALWLYRRKKKAAACAESENGLR